MFTKGDLIVCILVCSVVYCCCSSASVVTTKYGKIQGLKSHDLPSVTLFLKVPYAKPPVGDLRFRKPEGPDAWTGVLDATEYGPSCIQALTAYTDINYLPNKNISEDCLHLNIYVPGLLSNQNNSPISNRNVSLNSSSNQDVSHGDALSNRNLSVMIYIHGGSYYIGEGTRYDGSYLASVGNVIVVTINYRLGIFGFLSTGDNASPGNYGLWDQIFAMKWVKENIAAFGGNPSSITVFGQSAGGFCVSLHGFIPQNKGLFQRIIPESGVANSLIAVPDIKTVEEYSIIVANYTHCLDDTTGESINTTFIVECLRNQNTSTLENIFLQRYRLSYLHSVNLVLGMAPVVDGDLLTDQPYKLLADKTSQAYKFYRSLDVIIGTTNGEGSILFTYLLNFRIKTKTFLTCNGMRNIIAPTISSEIFYSNQITVSMAIYKKYKPSVCTKDNFDTQAQQVMNLYADALFVSPAVQALRVHADSNTQSKTYEYLFTRPSSSEIGPMPPQWFQGAPHGSELVFLFLDKDNSLENQEASDLRRNMVTYWSNFAKYG